jgi:hypothetical protein
MAAGNTFQNERETDESGYYLLLFPAQPKQPKTGFFSFLFFIELYPHGRNAHKRGPLPSILSCCCCNTGGIDNKMETTRWKRAAQAAAADNKKETTTTIHPSIHLTSINESIEGHKRNLPSVETKHTHSQY